MEFSVIIEPDLEDGGFIAHCPALKGCWSQGETEDEALTNIREAIIGCLKALDKNNLHEVKVEDKSYIRKVAVV